ncbi:Uncharacterized protein TCM_008432 isoform 2, partial [Theobroma cacao]
LSLPYHWEQCLDLKVRSLFVFFLLVIFFLLFCLYLLYLSFEMVTTVFSPFRVSDAFNAKPMADLALSFVMYFWFLFFNGFFFTVVFIASLMVSLSPTHMLRVGFQTTTLKKKRITFLPSFLLPFLAALWLFIPSLLGLEL